MGLIFLIFYIRQKTAYDVVRWLEFRRVLFRSLRSGRFGPDRFGFREFQERLKEIREIQNGLGRNDPIARELEQVAGALQGQIGRASGRAGTEVDEDAGADELNMGVIE